MLVEFAKRELEIAGLFYKDSDYNGMLGTAAMEIVEVFAEQGHSGNSAAMVIQIVGELMRYKPLTPLTSDPADWFDRTEESGEPMWQSKRNPSVFSMDGGKSYYDLDSPKGKDEILLSNNPAT